MKEKAYVAINMWPSVNFTNLMEVTCNTKYLCSTYSRKTRGSRIEASDDRQDGFPQYTYAYTPRHYITMSMSVLCR